MHFLGFIKRKKLTCITTIYWLVTGWIPLICIMSDFGRELGFEYAKFYSHLFIYPFMIGGASVYLSLRSIDFFFKLSPQQRFNLSFYGCFLFIFVVSASMTVIEISGKPAIWGVTKVGVERTIGEIERFQKSRGINDWSGFIEHFYDPLKAPPVATERDEENIDETINQRRSDFDEIITTASKKAENWSYTKYAYFLSLFVQYIAIFSLFTITLLICNLEFGSNNVEISNSNTEENLLILPPQYQKNQQDKKTKSKQLEEQLNRSYTYLFFSLISAALWLCMRGVCDFEQLDLYGEELSNTSATTLFIGTLCVLVISRVAMTQAVKHKEKVPAISSVIGFATGLIIAIEQATLGDILGSDAPIQSYLIFAIAAIVFFYPWYVTDRDKRY